MKSDYQTGREATIDSEDSAAIDRIGLGRPVERARPETLREVGVAKSPTATEQPRLAAAEATAAPSPAVSLLNRLAAVGTVSSPHGAAAGLPTPYSSMPSTFPQPASATAAAERAATSPQTGLLREHAFALTAVLLKPVA